MPCRRSAINTKQAFEKLLATFVKSTAQSMEAARELANMAIRQFEEHGDLSYAQSFLDAMPKNYIRRAAFIKWLGDHSPLSVEGETLTKDKSPDAAPFRVEVAILTSFWEYAPDPEVISYGSDDVIAAMKRTVAKFGKERYHAASDKAAVTVNMAKTLISEMEDLLKVDPDAVDTTEDDDIDTTDTNAPVEDTDVETGEEQAVA